jgi:multiple sugar transport system ATP-binding protein
VTHDQTEAMTLGDRVAVMRAGLLQQVDSPKELYERPRNLFVAGFIGSPSMNFVPGTLEDGKLRLPFGDVPLSDELRKRLEQDGAAKGREVIVGARPEHFEDVRVAGEGARGLRFRAKVDLLESMGSELYAYFQVKGRARQTEDMADLVQDAGMEDLPGAEDSTRITARLDPASTAAQGEEVELVLDTSKLQLFDPEGGRSLLHSS